MLKLVMYGFSQKDWGTYSPVLEILASNGSQLHPSLKLSSATENCPTQGYTLWKRWLVTNDWLGQYPKSQTQGSTWDNSEESFQVQSSLGLNEVHLQQPVGQLYFLPSLAFLTLPKLYVLRMFPKIPLHEMLDNILTTEQKVENKYNIYSKFSIKLNFT